MAKTQYTTSEVKRFASDFVRYLRVEQKFPIRTAYLFGSYAKGTPRDWSDVDVAIVSPKLKKDGTFSYLGTLRRSKDRLHFISPIGYHPHDFRSDDPLVREIKKYGIKIS